MKAVGIRELKNKLSEYIRQVKTGEEILVTDRGEVVAELRPPPSRQPDTEYSGLFRMAQQGRLRLGAPNAPDAYPEMPRVMSMAEITELLEESRGEH